MAHQKKESHWDKMNQNSLFANKNYVEIFKKCKVQPTSGHESVFKQAFLACYIVISDADTCWSLRTTLNKNEVT